MANKQELATEPKFDQDCKQWYFEQPLFIINGFEYRIIGTDLTYKDPKHDIRTFDGRLIQLKTSEIVAKFKELKK